METKFQTSFIPRKPLVPNSAAVPSTSHGGGSSSVLVLVSVIIFCLSVASAIVVFGWEKVEAKKIEESKVLLDANRRRFGTDIETLKSFNKRINVTKKIMDGHMSISNIFTMIADLTVDKVRFSNFTFEAPADPLRDRIEISMRGEADSFATLAYQTDVLSLSDFTDSSISKLSIGDKGVVSFDLKTVAPLKNVLYKSQFEVDADLETELIETNE